MHIKTDFLGLVFGLLVSLLLFYKIYTIVKAYIIPFLVQKLRELKKGQTELLEKSELLRSTLQRVESRISHQNNMFILLERKIKAWHQVMQDKQTEEQAEQERRYACILEKRKMQERQLAVAKEMAEAVPLALARAEVALMNRYAENDGVVLVKQFIGELDEMPLRTNK